MDGRTRSDIRPGSRVLIVRKQDQASGKLTKRAVEDIPTNPPHHPHGLKVRLTHGQVGRVQKVLGGVLLVQRIVALFDREFCLAQLQ